MVGPAAPSDNQTMVERVSETHDDPERLAQFIEICASQNDLFALDGQGNVYQYNFDATAWEKLASSRSQEGPRRSDHARAADRERTSGHRER